MSAFALILLFAASEPVADLPIESEFVQLVPEPYAEGVFTRDVGRKRAVVLVHGIKLRLFIKEPSRDVVFHIWQTPDHPLVKDLARDCDVYAYAYSQTAAVSTIAADPVLGKGIAKIKAMGYDEIVLVGMSAGGIIVREFAENNPAVGVTKVVQVSAPNTGAGFGDISVNLHNPHDPLLCSLDKECREATLQKRCDSRIPDNIQFVCVISDVMGGLGDLVVPAASQWSPDLRAQGIPAIKVMSVHRTMKSRSAGIKIAELIRTEQPRWSQEKVAEEQTRLLEGVKLPFGLRIDIGL